MTNPIAYKLWNNWIKSVAFKFTHFQEHKIYAWKSSKVTKSSFNLFIRSFYSTYPVELIVFEPHLAFNITLSIDVITPSCACFYLCFEFIYATPEIRYVFLVSIKFSYHENLIMVAMLWKRIYLPKR